MAFPEAKEFRDDTPDGSYNTDTKCYRGWNRYLNVITVDIYSPKEGRKEIQYSAGIYCEEMDGDFEEWLVDNFYDERDAIICECFYRDSAEIEIDYHNKSVDVVDFGDGNYHTTYVVNTGGEVFAY